MSAPTRSRPRHEPPDHGGLDRRQAGAADPRDVAPRPAPPDARAGRRGRRGREPGGDDRVRVADGGEVGRAVRIGTLADLIAANAALPIADGFPAFVPDARAFVMTIDPARGGWEPGSDPTGDGTALNVRAVSQRCPHLGCRPNPCVEDFWFRCPCHQSRYDRVGVKAAGVTYGPAARSMDRYPVEVDRNGVLTVDTSRVVLGPLPIALGQPGLIPPRVPNGCT